jgi:hypothetical protein
MQTQVQKMLDKVVIRPSNPTWTAPAPLVPKKSADGNPKYGFCVDFRALNAVAKSDPHPLPVFEETTSGLYGSKYFTVLDCFSGFWQVSIKEEHRERIGSLSRLDTMSLTYSHLGCPTVQQTFSVWWTPC